MATKKTETKKKAAPKKAAPKKAAAKAKATPKAAKDKIEAKAAGPRHPHGRVVAAHGGKEQLAKALAASLVREDEDATALTDRLGKASNQQLLRLQQVVATVKEKFGSRDKLIAAIGTAESKSKDKDYLAKLASFSLPQLLDIAVSGERRARA